MDRGKIIPSTCTWSGPYPTGIKDKLQKQGWSIGVKQHCEGHFSASSRSSQYSEAGAYSADSETVRGKHSRRDGYSAEPLFIWIARKKVCLSLFPRVPRRAGSSDLIDRKRLDWQPQLPGPVADAKSGTMPRVGLRTTQAIKGNQPAVLSPSPNTDS
jgi:hypothetical protein